MATGDTNRYTSAIVTAFGSGIEKLGYTTTEIDTESRMIPNASNCTVYGTVGFWKADNAGLEGIIVKDVKSYDENLVGTHGYAFYAIGGAGRKLVERGYNPISEQGIVNVTNADGIELNGKEYRGVEFGDSMDVLHFLNKRK